MNESNSLCDICYQPRSKITLECSHQLCLVCLLNIVNSSLICPFCRRQYNLFDEETIPPDIYVIEQANPYSNILIGRCYETIVNEDKFEVLLTEADCPCDTIKCLIGFLFSYPISLESIRQKSLSIGQYEIRPVEHYLQDYHDIIIKRIVKN